MLAKRLAGHGGGQDDEERLLPPDRRARQRVIVRIVLSDRALRGERVRRLVRELSVVAPDFLREPC